MAVALEPILDFYDEFQWASNFFKRPVEAFGRTWHHTEGAFQALKFAGTDDAYLERIAAELLPGKARRLGRSLDHPIRPGWDKISVAVMTVLTVRKFDQHPDLAEKLLATAGRRIVEGNTHDDRIWGAVWHKLSSHHASPGVAESVWWEQTRGDDIYALVGRNELGKILMVVRDALA